MGEIQLFSQLGVGIATLLILWMVVKYFIEALTKKDEYIKEIVKGFQANVDNFNTTINNHIDHQTASSTKLTEAIEKLIRKLDK